MWIPVLGVCGAGAVLLAVRGRVHFDWAVFFEEMRYCSPIHVAAAAALILSTNWIRSVRWVIFLRPVRRVAPLSLAGAHCMGFSAVALFGRIADLSRPYLVSRRVRLSLASQIAVYTIERIFDLGGVAVLFSVLVFAVPRGAAHHEVFVRTGLVALAGTLFLCGFALAVWAAGERVAGVAQAVFGRVSEKLAVSAAEKVLNFRQGLRALRSGWDLLAAAGLSVLMWGLIVEAYVQSAHAFGGTPGLAGVRFATAMPLLAASMGGSLLLLPIVGWFTQIAITASAMHGLYGAPLEAATACGAVLLIVNTLSVIPLGLLFARLEGISLGEASRAVAVAEFSRVS